MENPLLTGAGLPLFSHIGVRHVERLSMPGPGKDLCRRSWSMAETRETMEMLGCR